MGNKSSQSSRSSCQHIHTCTATHTPSTAFRELRSDLACVLSWLPPHSCQAIPEKGRRNVIRFAYERLVLFLFACTKTVRVREALLEARACCVCGGTYVCGFEYVREGSVV